MKSAGKVYDNFSNSQKKIDQRKKPFNWFFILKIKLSPFTSCFIEIAEDYPCQIMWWPRIQFNSWAPLREFTYKKQVTKKYNEIMNYCVFYSFYLAPTRKNQHQSAHALCLNSTAYSWVMKVNFHLKQCASGRVYLV